MTRKPILLLVDDDPAVLEALEVALGSAFSEIARIEPFADPAEALDAVRLWTEESRPVAVAVVDQKMPGMTGVQFLVRLRQAGVGCREHDHVTGHTRSVLLTGYASLDSALIAKNEAGIDRLIEKPWDLAQLVREIRRLFGLHLETSGTDRYIVLRELTRREEIEKHLRLRYEVYSKAEHTARLLPRESGGIDIDVYDPYSRLIGLFAVTLNDCMLAGTHRYIGESESPSSSVVREIAAKHESLRLRVEAKRTVCFPILQHATTKDALDRLFSSLDDRGETVMEASRFTVHPAFRAGRQYRKAAVHIIEGAMAFYRIHDVASAVTWVAASHRRFYFPYGFRIAEGTDTFLAENWGVKSVCLHVAHGWLPEEVQQRVETMTQRIMRTSEACRCDTFPTCLTQPYATGDFRQEDLFCPLRARELLALGDSRGADGWRH